MVKVNGQIEIRKEGKENKFSFLLHVITVFLSLLLAGYSYKAGFISIDRTRAFLASPTVYEISLLVLSLSLIAADTTSFLRKYSRVISYLLLFAFGFYIAELLYMFFPYSLPVDYNGFKGLSTIMELLNYKLIPRLYYIPAITPAAIVFFSGMEGKYKNPLQKANLSSKTDVLGRKNDTWKDVFKRFVAWLLLGMIIVSIFKIYVLGADVMITSLFFIPILLYAGWTAFIEEFIFRGILQQVFAEKLTKQMAIGSQAVLFGLIHVTAWTSSVTAVIPILFLYIFIGWFLGKAAYETGSIRLSFIFHFLIILFADLQFHVLT